jgi:hypothetical protein
MLAFAITGIWGIILCLGIIYKVAGLIGVIVSFFLLPITFGIAPFYAGFALDNWRPLIVSYGGIAVAVCLYMAGEAASNKA